MSNKVFPTEEFESLFLKENGNWWFLSRNSILIWVLRNKVNKFSNYLEVGCGTGFVLKALANEFPEVSLNASEYYEEGLVYARRRVPSCNFKCIDATIMSEENTYDCIGTFDVLEHIENDQKVVSNLYKALKPNGSLLISVPQHNWLWSHTDEFSNHCRRYSKRGLLNLLKSKGFEVIYSTSFVSLLLPVMFLQRRLINNNPRNYDSKAELGIDPNLNLALYFLMKVEIFILKLGFIFPLGGSLLVLVKKGIENTNEIK
ncbi:class I SAM-dependent methyltransferase [Prochlorococcus marinus]|uniref:class I SAM-dependent methyltransferase n=1 Tax=Prochlorococcus marinus TaxID=1219 RepID=UPI0022B2BA6A|nr:class I SAM-dependent methyltransferase [Prochlorococcus marinus]